MPARGHARAAPSIEALDLPVLRSRWLPGPGGVFVLLVEKENERNAAVVVGVWIVGNRPKPPFLRHLPNLGMWMKRPDLYDLWTRRR